MNKREKNIPSIETKLRHNILHMPEEIRKATGIVIYGRRRIGKTSLISEFIKDKNALFFLATEESESENRNAFTKKVAEYTNNNLLANSKVYDWETLFSYLV